MQWQQRQWKQRKQQQWKQQRQRQRRQGQKTRNNSKNVPRLQEGFASLVLPGDLVDSKQGPGHAAELGHGEGELGKALLHLKHHQWFIITIIILAVEMGTSARLFFTSTSCCSWAASSSFLAMASMSFSFVSHGSGDKTMKTQILVQFIALFSWATN